MSHSHSHFFIRLSIFVILISIALFYFHHLLALRLGIHVFSTAMNHLWMLCALFAFFSQVTYVKPLLRFLGGHNVVVPHGDHFHVFPHDGGYHPPYLSGSSFGGYGGYGGRSGTGTYVETVSGHGPS
ncbi:hypothetical protein AB6A40_006772 [Gnathostoma spinigerum]|uniref:Uncharacterized protein n=1 Tax=Gnathostoma spinigerum TaxID=75299 RepID=A0ABD6EJB1_9BILA